MTTIPLGPLALPTGPLAWLLALAAALGVARLVLRRAPADERAARAAAASDALWLAALVGFAVARVAFVLDARWAYAASPWSVLDIRDGGWSALPGVAAALAVLGWRMARGPALRAALATAVVAGAATWALVSTLFGAHDRPPRPALVLQDLRGAPVDLERLAAGRPMVINLWASWCPPCREEMPVFAQAQATWRDVVFVFANQAEPAGVAERFLAQQPYRLDHVLLDPLGQAAKAVGSRGLPTTLFYDAQGRLQQRHVGPLSAASLAAHLKAIAPGGAGAATPPAVGTHR
jgi:thiol-disulfide isomerase/thioredoxin